MGYRYDVYISYNKSDGRWVKPWLLPRLKRQRFRVIVRDDFRQGIPTLAEIRRVTNKTRKTILVLSPAYLRDEWNELEHFMCHVLDPGFKRGRLIPLIRKPVRLPLDLRTLEKANFVNKKDWRSELKRLVQNLRSKPGPDSVAAPSISRGTGRSAKPHPAKSRPHKTRVDRNTAELLKKDEQESKRTEQRDLGHPLETPGEYPLGTRAGPAAASGQFYIFSAHNHRDRNLAIHIAQALRAAGLVGTVESEAPAEDWAPNNLGTPGQNCDFIIPIISIVALDSPWLKHEVDVALPSSRRRKPRRKILLVMAEDCTEALTDTWHSLKRLRFYERDFDQALEQLVIEGMGLKVRGSDIRNLAQIPPAGSDVERWLVQVAPRHTAHPFRPLGEGGLGAIRLTDLQLFDLLDARIQKDLRIRSLAEITVSRFAGKIEKKLIEEAHGSFARLLLLGSLLFQETARRWARDDPKKNEKMIIEIDWDEAKRRASNETSG